MKFEEAWMSMAEGTTGTMTECARSIISCSMTPWAPAGASMMSWRVSGGTYMA